MMEPGAKQINVPSLVKHGLLRISKIENQGFRNSKSNKTEINKTDIEYSADNPLQRGRGTDNNPAGVRRKNAFCSFDQRDYDFGEVEKILLKSGPEKDPE